MNEHDNSNRFSRARIRQILARATELESRDDLRLSEVELREIAVEVGIDLRALEQAIAEIGPDAKPRLVSSTSFDLRTAWTAIIALAIPGLFATGVGASTGVVRMLTGSHGFHPESLAGLCLIVAAVLGASIYSQGTRRHLLFQLKNLGLWSGFAVGFALTVPILVDDVTGVGVVAALISASIGPFIVEYRRGQSLRGISEGRFESV